MAEDEPVTFVVERQLGWHEVAGVYHGKLPDRLTCKGSQLKVYALRLDKLSSEQQQYWLSKDCTELLDIYRWLRDEGTLPPPNLADPPKEKPRQGRELGNWWKPTPPPRGQDWTP